MQGIRGKTTRGPRNGPSKDPPIVNPSALSPLANYGQNCRAHVGRNLTSRGRKGNHRREADAATHHDHGPAHPCLPALPHC
jgi:hypothetical protein